MRLPVIGLTWLREEARTPGRPNDREAPDLPSVSWPPMLLPSYAALIRLDALKPGTLVAGSVAERAAARLAGTSVWTTWMEPAAGTQGPMQRLRGSDYFAPIEPCLGRARCGLHTHCGCAAWHRGVGGAVARHRPAGRAGCRAPNHYRAQCAGGTALEVGALRHPLMCPA